VAKPKTKTSNQKAPYAMPTVKVGMTVLWYPSPGTQEPTAAVVTRAGAVAVDLAIIPPESRALSVREGVLHVTDPRLVGMTHENADAGCWDFTDETKLLRSIAQLALPTEVDATADGGETGTD
jgi:hypothetical protein